MATYYVRPDGNDTNTGLAPTSASGTGAWRTVNKALSVAVGGDTVWIAAGTYRENVLPTIGVQSSMVIVTGDPTLTQVAWGSGLTAGIVRITNNLTNDSGTPTGLTLSLASKRYYSFTNIRFDGQVTFDMARDVNMTSCQFYGYGSECVLGHSGSQQTFDNYQLNVLFDRCVFYDTPIFLNYGYTNRVNIPNIVLKRCLLFVCNNTARSNAYIFSNMGNRWVNAFISLNCTYALGRSMPLYLMFHSGGSYNGLVGAAFIFRNNYITFTPTTNTFFAAGDNSGNAIEENYNASYAFSRSGVSAGANDITLQYSGSDNHGAYSSGFATYLNYTPTDDSPLRGAGLAYSQPTYALVSTPTTDFANNAWKQTNPTIGYLENGNVAPVVGTGGYVPLDRAVQTITTTAGSTGVSVHIYLGSTGVTFQTPNLTCYYARDNGASVQIPLVQGNASTWVSGGLFEVSPTTMPGVYKFDIPNAVIQAGAKSASIMLRGANAFNGAFVNVNIEAEPQPNYVSTNEFRLASEDAGYNNVLELNANTATTVKLQLLDMYQAPTNLTGATLSVEVYNSTNNLVASYTPTVRYAGNGEITFVLSTDVSATYGDYNVYCTKTSGSTDSVVYGPLSLRIRRL